MNRISAILMLSCCAICLAQGPQIKSGATVYIEPMGGYETYLAAAFAKKHVPLIIIAEKSKADYLVTSSASHYTPSQPTVVVNNGTNDAFESGMELAQAQQAARGSTSASISVIDAHSAQVVFAYAVGKSGNTNQIQSAAEASAKHLKEYIEKAEKRQHLAKYAQTESAANSPVIEPQNLGPEIATLQPQGSSGDPTAQAKLGDAYLAGRGVPKDPRWAAFWYRKAAEQGDRTAEFALGFMYDNGNGVPQDSTQAAIWYRKAAEQGEASAQLMLGLLYSNGLGVPQDYAQSFEWIRKAAEQGEGTAQYALGAALLQGRTIATDYTEAYFWLELATGKQLVEVKPEDVIREREQAASHLSAADILAVQERVRNWTRDHTANQ